MDNIDKIKCGRLIVVMERQLTAASRQMLAHLLAIMEAEPDITFVAGVTPTATLQAGKIGKKVFYNTCEHIPLWQVAAMVPWREVWLVAGGRVWCVAPRALVA